MMGIEAIGPVGFDMGSIMDGSLDGGVWRGDHTFHAGIAAYSLNQFIIPEIKNQHQEWTDRQVQEAGRQELALRLSQDHFKSQQETDRKPEMVTQWEVTETAPGMYELTTAYGSGRVSLSELWEHTYKAANDKSNPETYNPAAYNHEEEKAQLAMQDAFVSGKITSFVSVLSHPDGIRYASIWEKSHDGVVFSKTIDIGLMAGRDVSMEEATTFIHHIAHFKGEKGNEILESAVEYPHIMITRGTVQTQEIQTLVRAQTYIPEENARMSPPTHVYTDVHAVAATTKTLHDATYAALRESASSAHALGMLAASEFRKHKNAHKPLFLQLLEKHTDAKSVTVPTQSVKHEPIAKEKKHEEHLSKKQVSIREIVENHQRKKTDAKKALQVVVKIPVGVGAVPFLVTSLAQELPKPVVAVEKSVRRHKKKELHKNRKRFTHEQKIFLSVKRKKVEMVVQGKKERHHNLGEVKRKHKERQEEKKRIKRFVRILRVLSKQWNDKSLAAHVEVFASKKRKKKEHRDRKFHQKLSEKKMVRKEQRESRRQRKKVLIGFSFARILWFLLPSLPHTPEIRSSTSMHRSEPVVSHENKEIYKEALVQKEPAPWILLSIIWYLVMIREQGVRNMPRKNQTKKQTKQSVQTLPPHHYFSPQGVIFTYPA